MGKWLPNNSFKPNPLRGFGHSFQYSLGPLHHLWRVGLIQVLDDMAQPIKRTRGGQLWALIVGLLVLYLGVDAAWNSYQTGILVFTYRRLVATGPLAGFEMVACLMAGLYLVATSVRNLEDT